MNTQDLKDELDEYLKESQRLRVLIRDSNNDELYVQAYDQLVEDDGDRIDRILDLRDEIGADEFNEGVDLIPEDDFEDETRRLAMDIGAIDDDQNWPCNHINWEAAANDLKSDYSVFTFEGNDYYVRL